MADTPRAKVVIEPQTTAPSQSAALLALAALLGIGTATAVLTDTKKDEGVVYHAYPDLGGVWSICSGTAHGVKPGQVATGEECDAMTAADLMKAATIVLRVSPKLKAPEHHNQLRAVIRFQNNTGKYPVSSAHVWFNAGQYRKGCDALLAYNGIISGKPIRGAIQVRRLKDGRYFNVIRGLNNRRQAEHAICIQGAKNA
jgi:lysozyme